MNDDERRARTLIKVKPLLSSYVSFGNATLTRPRDCHLLLQSENISTNALPSAQKTESTYFVLQGDHEVFP